MLTSISACTYAKPSAIRLKPGQLIVVAARPSVGKTAFAANIALNAAKAGTPVLLVSLEQSAAELFERWLCGETGVGTDQLRAPRLSTARRNEFELAANSLASRPLLIDDNTPRTVSQIDAQARLHRRRDKIGLVIVDYLQLVSPEDRKANRETQVAEISRSLKLLARRLEIPVVALAQLNRAVESREERRFRLSDLRESGAIEQDADVVLFLDRPRCWDANADPAEASVHVAKHRNGKRGELRLHWTGETMQFRDAAPGGF